MKKLALITSAILLSTSAMSASAKVFEFDADGAAAGVGFIDVELFTTNQFPNDDVIVRQSFAGGADDDLLDNGDKFGEEIFYNNSTSTGTPDVLFPNPPNGLNFDITLRGEIANVAYGLGVPDLTAPATLAANLSATSFDTNFDTSAMNSEVAMIVTYGALVIGEFDLVDQVNSPSVSLDGTTVNQAFIFDWQFDDTWAAANAALIDSVWREDGGASINVDFFTIQSQGSAGPNGATSGFGVDLAGKTFVNVNVTDNGSTFKSIDVPEPASIALLGLGLLGLAGARRKA